MAYKKHDFIEIEYDGKLEDGSVFDTTSETTAKEYGLGKQGQKFAPAVICLGENHILPGIENQIIGKSPKEFVITLQPVDAFGKKNAKLLKLMPLKVFKKHEITPYPGLDVNIDNQYGIIKTVSGGRVIVDFNHPLSGKAVTYSVKVNKEVTDTVQKAKAMLKNELQIADMKLTLNGTTLVIDEDKFPAEVLNALKERLISVIPELKDVKLKKDMKTTSSEKSEKKEVVDKK